MTGSCTILLFGWCVIFFITLPTSAAVEKLRSTRRAGLPLPSWYQVTRSFMKTLPFSNCGYCKFIKRMKLFFEMYPLNWSFMLKAQTKAFNTHLRTLPLTPRKQAWNLKLDPRKRKFLVEITFFSFYVCFRWSTIFNTPICSKLGALFLFKVKTLRKDTTHLCLRLATQGFLEQLHAASRAALKTAAESEASDVESLGFDEEASPEATGSLVLDGWCLLRWMDFAKRNKSWPEVFFLGGGDTVGLLIDVLFNDEWLFFAGGEIWRFERFE